MVTIGVHNLATTHLGVSYNDLLLALQLYVTSYLKPAWGTDAQVVSGMVGADMELVFLDDADQADALGYHEVYLHQPLGKVFVRTAIQDGEQVSVTASHEIAEMLVDPDCRRTCLGQDHHTYALEVCDAVEETGFAVSGIQVSNFVLPSWYSGRTTPYDHLGRCTRPCQVLKGGYASFLSRGHWIEVYGSHKAMQASQKKGFYSRPYKRKVVS